MCQCVIYRGTCFLRRLSWPRKKQAGAGLRGWNQRRGHSRFRFAPIKSGKNKRSPLDWDGRMTLHTLSWFLQCFLSAMLLQSLWCVACFQLLRTSRVNFSIFFYIWSTSFKKRTAIRKNLLLHFDLKDLLHFKCTRTFHHQNRKYKNKFKTELFIFVPIL